MPDDFEKEALLYHIYQEDEQQENHRYVDEEPIIDAIRKGDVFFLEKNLDKIWPVSPVFVSGSEHKTEEYISVATIVLASRAAIEGGITSQESFRMSDLYLQRIARSHLEKELVDIRKDAVLFYARAVRDIKTVSKHIHLVDDVKAYVSTNIFHKISLADVAKALRVSKEYLAKVFMKQEGITVLRYIQRQKIIMASNMLKYSDRTIAEIAEYLNFVDQSYFGKLFKRETGWTPQQYRNKFRPPQF